MTFFNRAPLPSPVPTRENTINHPKDDVDDFLSSDLELSFASTMSLNSPSASRGPSPVPMDISPAQPQHSQNHLAPPVPRLFGREIHNSHAIAAHAKSSDTKSNSKGRQRAALPTQWLVAGSSPNNDHQSVTTFEVPQTRIIPSTDDAMEVDGTSPPPAIPATPAPVPLVANASYSNLFFAASSPEPVPAPFPALMPKKRRSPSPELNQSANSSDPPSSPSQHKFTRAATVGVGAPLFKKTMLEYNVPSTTRIPPRRPALSALVAPTHGVSNSQTAHPDLETDGGLTTAPLVPVRRAFSAMVPPTVVDPSSDETTDIQSSSPAAAAYAKRHQARVIRRCDGTDELRPLVGAGSLGKRDREVSQYGARANTCSPRSLAGFGVKEIERKILPCHRVSEDGLVRISPDILNNLLSGAYLTEISKFIIVDCRFDYEYEGGHISGAINLNTTSAIEDHFFGADKPIPAESGEPAAKTVLIFHCEFSVKRAPTFAKHLRSKDRAMNGRVYPKVCYPEIYILEGGFCQFFKEYPNHCEPQGYVQMDDPAYSRARDADLNNFRRGKWERTQSYTYGQKTNGTAGFPLVSSTGASTTSQENRKTAPSGAVGGSMFAAANAARGRRVGGSTAKGLSILEEDASSSGHEDGDSGGVEDSPCPPPSKGPSRPGLLSKARTGLDRAASHGATVSTRR